MYKIFAKRRITAARSLRPLRLQLRLEHLEPRDVRTSVITTGHVHFQLDFDNGAWQPFELEDTTHSVSYDPTDTLIFVSAAQQTVQPAGWNFIGAGDGNPYWHVDSSSSSPFVSLSIATENILSGTFDTYQPADPRVTFPGEWIKLEMRKVNGPGFVSNWQNGQPPSAWWMSSYDGGRTRPAAFYIEPGGHTHLNWAFTAKGIYQVTLEASAFLPGAGLPIYSEEVTLRFLVERRQTPLPAPPGADARAPLRQLSPELPAAALPRVALPAADPTTLPEHQSISPPASRPVALLNHDGQDDWLSAIFLDPHIV
jgi:surface-anchored protein